MTMTTMMMDPGPLAGLILLAQFYLHLHLFSFPCVCHGLALSAGGPNRAFLRQEDRRGEATKNIRPRRQDGGGTSVLFSHDRRQDSETTDEQQSQQTHGIVWFRSHALRQQENAALQTAAGQHPQLHFVHLWDSPIEEEGGTARDVFVANALHSLNETLGGQLVVMNVNDPETSSKNPKNNSTDDYAYHSVNPRHVQALHRFIQDVVAASSSADHESSSSSVVLYYLESLLDQGSAEWLQEQLQNHQEQLQQQQQQRRATTDERWSSISIQVQSFAADQTLLDYHPKRSRQHDDDDDKQTTQAVTNLIRNAIQQHPFNSPLIPFVDMVVKSLLREEEEEEEEQTTDKKKNQNGDNLLAQTQVRAVPKTSPSLPYMTINELRQRLGTTRNTKWGKSIAQQWPATEEAANEALDNFVNSQYSTLLSTTPAETNQQDSNNESRASSNQQKKPKRPNHLASSLSPYLSVGLLSPRQVYQALQSKQREHQDRLEPHASPLVSSVDSGSNSFLRRLAWRDYAYAATLVFPDAVRTRQPIRSLYNKHRDGNIMNPQQRSCFQLWKEGNTGYPLVDAGMRQLIQHGFMPQQVRLVASACLVEGLNVPWQCGMKHFEEYLVDFDVVINTHMWQNAGSVGLDPYYIGLDFKKRPYWDADGSYVRQWCPELKRLPEGHIEIPPVVEGVGGTNKVDALYNPWRAPPDVLERAQVTLGQTYPERIVNERDARRGFLQDLRDCRLSWGDSHIDTVTGDDIISVGGEPMGVFTPRSLKFAASR